MASGVSVTLGRRLPLILQGEAAECGLACIAMVAGYHGYETDLLTLRRRHPVSMKGATLAQLIDVAEALNLSCRPLRLELENLAELKRPAILHWDFCHFVVLKAVRGRKVYLHDPAVGLMIVPLNEVSNHFTGVALELTPTPRFERKRERERLPLRMLWGQQVGLKGFLAQLLTFSVALEAFAILTPYFMQLVVDRVLVAGNWNLLTVLGLGFAMLAVVTAAVKALRAWVIVYLSTHLNYQMLSRLFRHLLRLPLEFFAKRHVGDLVSRFSSLETIQHTLTTQFVESLVDGIMAVGTLAVMLIYSGALTAVAMGVVSAYALLRWSLYRSLRRATYEHILREARQASHFLETVRGMQGFRLFGAEPMRHAEWQNRLAATLNAQAGVGKLNVAFTLGNGLVTGLGGVAIIWLGAGLILKNQLSVGMLFAFAAFATNFTTKAVKLIENGVDLKMLTLHSERVADIALGEEEQVQAPGLLSTQQFCGAIAVRGLGYRYGTGDAQVLADVDFSVAAGETLAITGPSGVGKSTLMKIMLGLFRPNEGAVLADGIDIVRFGLAEYRRHVAAVLQDDQLYTGTIADNISFFDSSPDAAWIEECARRAAIDDEILAMPMGFRSLIGDMGTVLSGGQKQRVLLARALYRRPRVLYLDEATSHLDPARESIINDMIRGLNITRIVVAHRKETRELADRVLRLSPSGIVETTACDEESAAEKATG